MATLLLLPMFILGLGFLSVFRETLLERFQDEQTSMFNSIKQVSIESQIGHIEGILKSYRNDPRMKDLFKGSSAESIQNEWSKIVKILSLQIDIFCADPSYRYISSTNLNSSSFTEPERAYWYGVGVDSDEILWTDPYLSNTNSKLIISGVSRIEGMDKQIIGVDFELNNILTSFKNESYGMESKLLAMTPDGNIINFNRKPSEPVEYSSLYNWVEIADSPNSRKLIELNGKNYYAFSVYIESISMHLISLFPQSIMLDKIRPFIINVIIIISISTLFMLAGSYVMSENIIKNIKSMNTYMAEVSEGNYELKTCVKGNDEFKTLNDYLNVMVDVLSGNILMLDDMNRKQEHLIEVRTTLLHIISHSASTPVTVLINNSMELMAEDSEKEEYKQMFLASDNLKSLLDNTMIYLKLEEGIKERNLQLLDLNDITNLVCINYESRLKGKALELSVTLDELFIHGHYFLIKTVIENLIDNAVKYSFPGGALEIGGSYHDDQLEWWIRDAGPGFSEQDKKELFSRFKRLSARPTGGESSTGLGLYLVKNIMLAFGGDIILEPDIEGKGACFKLIFPLFSDAVLS
ncbi:MAG: sensor histidine kinase [Spirochaetales bacterium]|nr:sensor histidine kinase [Spirochaetales bacterium]